MVLLLLKIRKDKAKKVTITPANSSTMVSIETH